MKKRLLATVLSLMLVIGLVPTAALAVGTVGTFAARIGVSENSVFQLNGQNVLEVGFYIQSDNMPIRAGQNVLLALDMDVLELLAKNGKPLTESLPSSGAPLQLSGKLAYTAYEDPDTLEPWSGTAYVGKSADGKIGYLMLQPTLLSMNASSCVEEIKLMSSLVGFKPGKSKADLTKDTIRFATPVEGNNFNQSYVMTVNDGDKIDMNMGSSDGLPDTFIIPPVIDMGSLVSTGPVAPTGVTLSASSNSVTVGSSVTFTANATVTDSGALTYTLKNEDGVVVAAQAGKTFNVPLSTVGTKNYYVTATNTLDGKTATADSAKVAVTVTAAPVGGAAKLLTLIPGTASDLIQKGSNKVGFAAGVTSYSLSFKDGVSTDISITTDVSATTTTQYSLDGTTYTAYTNSFNVTGSPASVYIKASEAGKQDTIYQVELIKRTEGNPQATFKLTNEGAGISKLTLTGFKNASNLTNFDLILNLTDANIFTGFTDKDGKVLTGNEANPFELNAAGTTFMVSSFTPTATSLTIHFTMGPSNSSFVDASKIGMNIYLQQKDPANPSQPHVAVNTVKSATTSSVTVFGLTNDKWTDDGKNDETSSLVYLMADKANYTLDMYFNKVGNNKKIETFLYTIKEQSADTNLVTDQPLSALLGKFSMNLNNGTYVVTVKGAGHVTYTKTVTIANMSEAIPAVMLLGGDLDGNNVIDSTDMLRLLDPNTYNHSVGGAVTAAFDFNGDGQVDIMDLGVLVRNMGATY